VLQKLVSRRHFERAKVLFAVSNPEELRTLIAQPPPGRRPTGRVWTLSTTSSRRWKERSLSRGSLPFREEGWGADQIACRAPLGLEDLLISHLVGDRRTESQYRQITQIGRAFAGQGGSSLAAAAA
jgi:hypothetical protein